MGQGGWAPLRCTRLKGRVRIETNGGETVRSLPGDTLPKGMEPPPSPPGPGELTLAEVNYAGIIRKALAALPFDVRVQACEVRERDGTAPEILLHLTIHRREEDA